VLIFIRHHENIARLLKGEEPRIGQKAAAPPTPSGDDGLGHNGGPPLRPDDLK
jgi:acyl phosphate:glycerol-3-phosphate acyltransferase